MRAHMPLSRRRHTTLRRRLAAALAADSFSIVEHAADAPLPAPWQVATLLNVLRFVDAVNALLFRRLVPVGRATAEANHALEDALAATYGDLMAWGDEALQARFSGTAQYLKSAKRFGLLHFAGEAGALPTARSSTIASISIGCSRQQLLERASLQPHLIVPALVGLPNAADKLLARLHGPECVAMVQEYLCGSFDDDRIYTLVYDTDTDDCASDADADDVDADGSDGVVQ